MRGAPLHVTFGKPIIVLRSMSETTSFLIPLFPVVSVRRKKWRCVFRAVFSSLSHPSVLAALHVTSLALVAYLTLLRLLKQLPAEV